MKYTVIGVWSDDLQPWSWRVEARDPMTAVAEAVKQAERENEWGDELLGRLMILDVVAGYVDFYGLFEWPVTAAEVRTRSDPRRWRPKKEK